VSQAYTQTSKTATLSHWEFYYNCHFWTHNWWFSNDQQCTIPYQV